MISKVYCLTLRQTPQREQVAREEVAKHGLDAEFVYGFNGAKLGLVCSMPTIQNDMLPTGMVGCFASHILLWTLIERGSDEEVLILEDDVVLVDGFKDRLAEVYPYFPPDWEYIHLGHDIDMTGPLKHTVILNERIAKGPWITGTYCNIIKKATATKFLQIIDTMDEPIDYAISRRGIQQRLNNYIVHPALATHRTRLHGEWRTQTLPKLKKD